MASVWQRCKARMALWALLPVDHYTALGLSRRATAAEVEQAYQATLARSRAPWHRQVLAVLRGQSPARLAAARAELLDPVARAAYDRHQDMLRGLFSHPPQ